MRLSRLIPVVATAVLAAAPAHAQQWGGPLFSSPLDQSRFEILSSDANGAGMGIAVAVRPFSRVADLRLRAGIMDGLGTGPFSEAITSRRREIAYMAGIDYAMPLNPQAGGPVRASLVTGLGVGVNAETVVSAPLGFSIAYDGGSIRPYMTPRVVLEHHSGPAPYVGPWEGRAVVDWGVDVSLPVGGTLRAALTTGSYKAFGIGLSF
ncbi:hypothetical protein [Longimicrobium sp.]|jgi:hypothetical protein|uniref:hypothetical protein n=1 Tax=Longimicrobium sp. TaxID=2029185 RepID=UPI002ED7EF47